MSNDFSRAQWRWTAEVDSARDLTWGHEIDGSGIVAALDRHALLASQPSILEIGPGSGRLYAALQSRPDAFRRYTGIEINATRAQTLRHLYPCATWYCADITAPPALSRRFDLIVSFLVFKHLYPDFTDSAAACRALLTPDGTLAFDLRETQTPNHSTFDEAECFVRRYTRAEAEAILRAAGFTKIEYGHVDHDSDHRRLLVIARA